MAIRAPTAVDSSAVVGISHGSAATSMCPLSRQRRWRAMATLSSTRIIRTTASATSSKKLACRVRLLAKSAGSFDFGRAP
eukprot:6862706-Prymnesium_polylepis.1